MMNLRAKQNAPAVSIIEMGGRGGLNFSFDLSKIVAPRERQYTSPGACVGANGRVIGNGSNCYR